MAQGKVVTATVTKSRSGHAFLTVTLPQGHGNDAIVADVDAVLTTMKESGELPGGQVILVNGQQTVAAAYVYSHHLVHLYAYVAMFDPKLAPTPYVVVAAHGPDHKVGDKLTE